MELGQNRSRDASNRVERDHGVDSGLAQSAAETYFVCFLPSLNPLPWWQRWTKSSVCSSFEARKSAQLRTEDGDAFERRLWRHLGSSRRSSCPTRASGGPRTERGRGGATHLEQNAIPARTRSCRPPSAHSPPRRGQEGGGRRPTDGVLLFGIFLDVFFREGQEV